MASKNFQYLTKRKLRTRHEFLAFLASDLDLANMTLGQGHDTAAGHKQSLCEVRTSNVYPQKNMDRTRIAQTDGQGFSYISLRPPHLRLWGYENRRIKI